MIISRRANWLLLLGVAVLMIAPLAFIKGEYGGSDDAGSAAVAASQPGFKPWFEPIWKPPSPEIESLLFAVQAAIGAGTIGYVIGRIHGAARERETARAAPAQVHAPQRSEASSDVPH